nr:S9 family peptidase [Gemmatimonadaceae bacterium]
FDSTRAYPVLLHTYGGPAAPQVVDRWGARTYLFHQLLAQRGYVVLVVDPRGAAWRGRAFRKVTQLRLGLRESDDLIATARWLLTQRWVDRTRIGMWGWSYGGFMTALTTARGGDLFKAGIVVAPVTDWRYYDTIYTERYMGTPTTNGAGYAASSVQSHIAGLRARLLLVHGTGDDNVHPQNTFAFADALVQADKRFEMLLYPNRTHSISGGNTSAHLFESVTRFLLEHL